MYACLSLILCVLGGVIPVLSAKTLMALTSGTWDKLIVIVLIFTLADMCYAMIAFFNKGISNIFFRDILTSIQFKLSSEILKLRIEEIDNNTSGKFIERLSKDTRIVADIFLKISHQLSKIFTSVGILIAIFIINKIMFIFFICSIFILFYFKKVQLRMLFERRKVYNKISDENTGLANELIRGIRDIKILNCQNEFMYIMGPRIKKLNEEQYRMSKINRKFQLLDDCVIDVITILFFVLGIILCSNNLLTISSFVVLYSYNNKVYNTLNYVFVLAEQLKEFNVSAQRMFELTDNKTFKKEEFGKKHLSKTTGKFEFKNVTFSYKDKNPVLKNMSFKIKANETVAFVGKSGSGKTTIFNLLTKLYDVKKGEILIDNININNLDMASIRNNMSMISQSPYIFNFSVIDNLRVVKPNATKKEIIKVCKLACIHDYIMTLPEKYNTIVGEGGHTLSGGQRQRLAIARALLQKTEIILFDEATSALDNVTQKNILNAINNMKGEYTILIIAHRLSTVKNCHRIIFIDEGKVIDSGTHDELLKRNKKYQLLYEADIMESEN